MATTPRRSSDRFDYDWHARKLTFEPHFRSQVLLHVRYRIFWAIVLPLALPGLVATFLFVLVFAWNEYLLSLFLSSSRAQTLPLTVAAQNATRGPQWWYLSVLVLIMIVPVIGMAIALERYIARGLLVGAIKG